MRTPDEFCVAGIECFFFGERDDRTRPLVFALHGVGGNATGMFGYCRQLREDGLNVIALDHRNHGRRYVDARHNSCKPELLALLAGVARDIGLLLDFLPIRAQLEPNAVGMLGTSMGGCATLLTMMLEPRIAVGVAMVASGEFEFLFQKPGATSTQPECPADLSAVRKILARYDPIRAPATFADRPLLLLNGEEDPTVPVDSARRFAEAAAPHYTMPERFRFKTFPGVGHEITDTIWTDARAWLKRWLLDTTAAPSWRLE